MVSQNDISYIGYPIRNQGEENQDKSDKFGANSANHLAFKYPWSVVNRTPNATTDIEKLAFFPGATRILKGKNQPLR